MFTVLVKNLRSILFNLSSNTTVNLDKTNRSSSTMLTKFIHSLSVKQNTLFTSSKRAHTTPLMSALLTLCVFSASESAQALILNPSPADYYNDVGEIAFTPSMLSAAFEIFDLPSAIGIPATFGFYRTAAPNTKVVIFDALDQGDPQPLNPAVNYHQAAVNFGTGFVFDVDQGVVQSTFASGLDTIGFYLSLNLGTTTLNYHSDPALNALGLDQMAIFKSKTVPNTYLIGTEVYSVGQGRFVTAYFSLIAGITAVPEPVALPLMSLGLISLWFSRRKRLAA